MGCQLGKDVLAGLYRPGLDGSALLCHFLRTEHSNGIAGWFSSADKKPSLDDSKKVSSLTFFLERVFFSNSTPIMPIIVASRGKKLPLLASRKG